jgi:eukaryotic-like serine/threonine-protein kinase
VSQDLEDLRPGGAFGPYQVIAELGQGGMGRVLRARHTTLQRDVALKVLSPRIADDPFFAERFLREARAAARLNHPNIVQVYDFGEVSGRLYLAMEFVEGQTLGAILRDRGPFREEEAKHIGGQACAALHVAHQAGLVHRDLKPENLMLTTLGVVKIVDLGLARMTGDDGAQTATGSSAGTPHYMPPEQIEAQRDIDGRADVYSLAATLFHLATGQLPFPGATAGVIMSRHLNEDAPDARVFAPQLSASFARALVKAMARRREDRTPSALAFALDLAATSAPPAALILPPTLAPYSASAGAQPRTPTPTSHATPIPGWDPALLTRIENELMTLVGPMARVLVRRAAKQTQDGLDLRRRLAQEIPGERERQAFLASGGPPSTPSAPSALSQVATQLPSPSGIHLDSDPRLPSAERILAEEIGPLARVLVRRVAKRTSTWEAFAEEVCGEVPDPSRRGAVQAALGRLGLK